jgi:NitT/TauT family transport system permease protein
MKSEDNIKEITGTLKPDNSLFSNIIHSFKSLLHSYLAIIIFLLIWEILPTIGVLNPLFIPTPSTIAIQIYSLTLDGTLPIATLATFSRVLVGLGLALLVAVPIGFLLGGLFKNFERVLNPLIRVIEQGNPLTLFHVFVLFIGVAELSTLFVVYWAAQWPILNNTVSGARNIDPVLVKVGRAAGLGKFDIFWKIQLPAALPILFTGIRLGVIFAFLILLGVEMMGMSSGNGLGYYIMETQMAGMIPQMWAAIVTLAILTISINLALLEIEKRLTKWKSIN